MLNNIRSRIRSSAFLRRKIDSFKYFSTTADETFGGYDKSTFCNITESVAPFVRNFLKVKVTELSKGRMVMELPLNPDFVGNPIIPCLHGGIAAALIDHCGGFCAWSILTDKRLLVSTADFRVDYLRPAPLETLVCEAEVIHQGQRLIRTDIVLWNKDKTKKLAIGELWFIIAIIKII